MRLKPSKLLFGTRCTNHGHRPGPWEFVNQSRKRASRPSVRTPSDPIVRTWKRAAESCSGVVIDPEIADGVPVLAGSHVPVYSVLSALEFHGSISSIIDIFPGVSESQLKDAIRFAGCLARHPNDYLGAVNEVPPWVKGSLFWNAKSIDQLVMEQGTRPVTDLSLLSGAIPDDELDEFVADIYRQRN